MIKVVASLGLKPISKTAFPQVDGFTPHAELIYSSYSREKASGGLLSGVVATLRFSGTGYHPFPQVDGFTPQTCGIYSPSLATRVVATFWLPTGYQRKPTFRGVNLDVAARGRMHRTREHRLEKWEPLSGSDEKALEAHISPDKHAKPLC